MMSTESSNTGLWCILFSQMLERVSYYSVLANLFFILNSYKLCWSNFNSSITIFLFNGFCYLGSLLSGILADVVLKKNIIIIIGYILYSSYGVFVWPLYSNKEVGCTYSTCNSTSLHLFQEKNALPILTGLFFTGWGSGLIHGIIASTGSDIVLKQKRSPAVFFNLYYWFLNFGSLAAFLGFSYIQQNISKFIGTVIPCGLLVISFFIYIIGTPYYVNVLPQKSTPKLLAQVVVQSLFLYKAHKTNSKTVSSETGSQNKFDNAIFSETEESDSYHSMQRSFNKNKTEESDSYHSNQRSFNKKELNPTNVVSTDAIVISKYSQIIDEKYEKIYFLDRAKIRFGGTFSEEDVENVRKFFRVILILIFMIPYWVLYNQLTTTFISQGLHMDVGLRWSNRTVTTVPGPWLAVMNVVIVMFLIPVLIRFFYPWLAKHNIVLNFKFKLIFGMALCSISLLVAGFVEIIKNDHRAINVTIHCEGYVAHDISIFLQVPQYCLMGISEVFAVVSALELACTQVPKSMQGLSNGIFYFFSGVGSFISIGIMYLYSYFNTPKDKSNFASNVDYYFFILAAFPLINLFLLVPIMNRYTTENYFISISTDHQSNSLIRDVNQNRL